MRSGKVYQLVAVIVYLCLTGASWAGQAVIYGDPAATGANDGSSWTDAYVVLQDALAAAVEANKPLEIRVAQGIYTPDQRDPFQLLNDVALKGGYAGVAGTDPNDRDVARYSTTLSADSWTHVVTGDGTDPTAVIEGVVLLGDTTRAVSIRNGSPTFIDCRLLGGNTWPAIEAVDCNSILVGCRFEGNEGEGIVCWSSHLTLRDCAFIQNENDAIDSRGSTLDLLRCSFVGNRGAISCSGTMVARGCRFVRNVSDGEAVLCLGDSTFVDCRFVDNASTGAGPGALGICADVATVTRCLFAGNSGSDRGSGALQGFVSVLRVSDCLFAGNSGGQTGPGAIFHRGLVLRAANCTFADNRGTPTAGKYDPPVGADAELAQCIVWDGPDPFTGAPSAVYSNLQGGYEGKGNMEIDPCFVAPGHWDPNGTPDDPNDDVWVMGDYHLKSQAGHWDQQTESWVFDEVTSLCIDAGDPNGPLGVEPFPNGGFGNLGAYGGTAKASRSYFGAPVCETQIAGDINGDCIVDDLDLDILTSHWLMPDIGKANIPPTISIISPEDGAELTEPRPIILRVDASDPDGTIVQVEYRMEYEEGNTSFTTGTILSYPTDSWVREHGWSHIRHAGPYEIWAQAVDDAGAIVVSDPITVTLHPADPE